MSSTELALGPNPTALRSEVMRSIDRTPDLGYGLYHVAAAYGQMALMIALLQVLPAGWFYKALYFVAMGWTQYRIYFVIHEACHFTLFDWAKANRIVGRISCAMLFTSFSTFTWIHMEHHRLWGTEEDPGSIDYYVRFRSKFHQFVFFFEPFLCLILFTKVNEHLVQPIYRFFFHHDDDVRRQAKQHARKMRPKPMLDLFLGVVVQLVLATAITGFWTRPFDHLFFYMFPLGTVFLFLARLRMYLEHGPLDYAVSDYTGDNERRIARTHERGVLDGWLLQYMNFRFHQEHHIFPSLPSCRLREVHERFIKQHLHPDDLSPSYAHSLREIARLTD